MFETAVVTTEGDVSNTCSVRAAHQIANAVVVGFAHCHRVLKHDDNDSRRKVNRLIPVVKAKPVADLCPKSPSIPFIEPNAIAAYLT